MPGVGLNFRKPRSEMGGSHFPDSIRKVGSWDLLPGKELHLDDRIDAQGRVVDGMIGDMSGRIRQNLDGNR